MRDSKKTQKLVLFLAAHGAVDEHGPYLLPEGADPADPDNIVRVADILDQLKQVPCSQKLLILDATQVPTFWPLGQLHNDFTRALQDDLKQKIGEVDGLVVLCASSPDQQSWVSDGWQMSTFSHAVIEGLKGAADADGNRRVTAKELFDYTTKETDRWVRANREAVQAPVLLDPHGRAGSMELNVIADDRQAPAADEVVKFAPPADLADLWLAAEALRRERPAVTVPHLWRRYLDMALRVEELLRAGDRDDADHLRKDLDTLAQQIRDAGRLPVGSLPGSLALPAALGDKLSAQDRARLDQALDRLWDRKDAADDEFNRLADDADGKAVNPRGLLLRRQALADSMLRRAAANPDTDLVRSAHRLPRFDGPRPTEAEPLRFLADHLAPGVAPDLVRRAIETRRRGEQAALGLADGTADLPACSEQVRPWLQEPVEGADAQRRLGEDLLLSAQDGDRAGAGRDLTEAEDAYKKAQDAALRVRKALAVRAEALAELPYYSQWLVARPPADPPADEADLTKLERLWANAHALDRLLQQPQPAAVATLDKAAGDVSAGLGQLRDSFDKVVTVYAAQDAALQASYHQIDALLHVPFIAGRRRESLLRNLGTIANALETKGTQAAGLSEAQLAEETRVRVERSARLAIAELGKDWIQTAPDHDPPAPEALVRGGKSPEDWRKTLAQAGAVVRFHRRRLLTETNRLTEQANGAAGMDGKDGSLAELAQASNLARHLDGAAVGRLTGDPVDDYRRLQGSDLLTWLSWRVARDNWGGEGSTPYYRQVAHDYLDAADSLALLQSRERDLKTAQKRARKERVDLVRQQIDSLPEPVLQWFDPDAQPNPGEKPGAFRGDKTQLMLDLIEDDALPRAHRVNIPKEASPAAPVVFASDGKLMQVFAADLVHRAVLIPPGDPASPSVTFTLALQLPPGAPPTRVRTEHIATALYRGRVLQIHTNVGADLLPGTTAWRPEADITRVAVQAAPDVYERFAAGRGRLTIVLDCSGSMNAKQNVTGPDGNPLTRFDLARTALNRVLKELPAGTKVSIWIFAQKKPGIQEEEETIQQILPPQAWGDPARPMQLDNLMKEIGKLTPWHESPILRAMLQAKGDLEGGDVSGYRTLLVLTDGDDNRFEGRKDPEYNPDGKKQVQTVLKEQFEKSGIAVKMVGFQLSDEERKRATRQFISPIPLLPQGEYFPADKLDDLVEKLRKALRQQLAYRVLAIGDSKNPKDEQTVTRIGSNPSWARLGDAEYNVRVDALRPLTQRVHTRTGDSLLLKLVQNDRDLALERVLYAKTNDPLTLPPPVKAGSWLLGFWQNQRTDRGYLQVRTTVELAERLSARPEEALDLPRPNLAWFEVHRGEDKTPVPGLRFYPLYAEPAPAWRLDVPDWSEKDAPTVQTWWAAPDGKLRALTVARGPDYDSSPEQLQGKAISAGELLNDPAAHVIVESVRWEERRSVPVAPDRLPAQRPCLVIRLRYPKGKPFIARLPESLSAAGEEHRIYRDANKYVGVFWSLTKGQVEGIQNLSFVSLADFKVAAEQGGLSRTVELPAPR